MKRILAICIIVFSLTGCNVSKENDKGSVSFDVDIKKDRSGGHNVDWQEANVGTTMKTVEVPKTIMITEEQEMEVPFIDVDMPNAGEKEERTLVVEAEVDGKEHSIEIQEIWAVNENIYVISILMELDADLKGKKMRVSDQVTLNAPDLNVKHYIVGAKPNRIFNNQHRYMKSMDDVKSKIGEYTIIYKI